MVLLPGRWAASAPPRAIDAILAHELAHARRRDQVVNLAQRLAEVALFFHPAVHWLSRSLRRERELCADALAVRLTGDPLALAESLQSVARLRLESRRIPAAGTSLGGPSVSLLPRIQELIGMTPPRPRLSAWPFAALPAAGFLALVAAAAGAVDDRPAAPAATEGDRPPAKAATPRETPQHTAFLEPFEVARRSAIRPGQRQARRRRRSADLLRGPVHHPQRRLLARATRRSAQAHQEERSGHRVDAR